MNTIRYKTQHYDWCVKTSSICGIKKTGNDFYLIGDYVVGPIPMKYYDEVFQFWTNNDNQSEQKHLVIEDF